MAEPFGDHLDSCPYCGRRDDACTSDCPGPSNEGSIIAALRERNRLLEADPDTSQIADLQADGYTLRAEVERLKELLRVAQSQLRNIAFHANLAERDAVAVNRRIQAELEGSNG